MINPAVYGIRDTHPSWPAARRRSCGFVVFSHFWGGLGGVGWGNNVSCLAFSHGCFPCSSTDASCYLSTSSYGLVGVEGVAMTSVALRAQTDATLLSYLLHFHMHWMPRQRIFSCTCTRAGCYVIESLLHLQEHWMLRHRSFSCNCTCTGCYVKGFFFLHLHTHWMPRFTIFCCFYTHWMLRHRIFSCKDYLPKQMCMKCKEKGHTKMHPSVPDYIYMWCWRQFRNNCTTEISGKDGRIALTTAMAKKWCQINFVKSKHHQNQLLVVVKLYTCFATFACNDHFQNTTTWLHVKTGVAAHLLVTKYIESHKTTRPSMHSSPSSTKNCSQERCENRRSLDIIPTWWFGGFKHVVFSGMIPHAHFTSIFRFTPTIRSSSLFLGKSSYPLVN